jgi:hypothetical protein
MTTKIPPPQARSTDSVGREATRIEKSRDNKGLVF